MNSTTTPWIKLPKYSSLILAAALAVAFAPAGQTQTLLLSLQAQNYNPITGVWTDTSGNGDNATVAGGNTAPALMTGVTPNGSSAVDFETLTSLTLATGITAGNTVGYTVFVFLQPDTSTPNGFTNGNGGTIFGGSVGGFQLRLSNLNQDIVQQAEADLGHGSATAPINAAGTLNSPDFSTIDVTTSPSGGSFMFDGNPDGTSGGSNYGSNAITVIGSNANGSGSEFFNGDITDIEIYSGTMTGSQRAAVEQTFTTEYVNAVPEPGTWSMALAGVGALLSFHRFRARNRKA